jgi:hypothetical protein
LKIPNTNDFNFGTGDFTIEWYQYQTDSNSFSRIFQVGNFSSGISIGVSIERGKFYYWSMDYGRENYAVNYDNAILVKEFNTSEYKNIWIHFAISRFNGIRKIFMNGTLIHTASDTKNYNGLNDDLVIGNQSSPTAAASFGGYIYYFSWVKGLALYSDNFMISNNYPILKPTYVLLLTAFNYDGTLGNTVVNNNVSIVQTFPPKKINLTKSLYTDNALVFYNKGSLPSCGVGTVRNSSIKSKKT